MIKDKHPAPQPAQPSAPAESLPEEVSANPFVEIYRAVKRAVLTLRENPDDPLSPPLFKTVAIDNGQFARIVRDDNTEYETVFPAVFIHFINVRYLVQQQRIGEGRATMRVVYPEYAQQCGRRQGMRGVSGLPAAQCSHTGCQEP